MVDSVSRYAKVLAEFELPVVTYSPNHAKMNPQTRGGKIAKSKRTADTRALFKQFTEDRTDSRCDTYKILLTRVSQRELDDDNVEGALKAVRDGVADGLGLKSDKRSKKLHWDYGQAKGPRGYYGVRVKIEGIY